MEDASLSTRVRVSYLQVAGQATESNALPFLGSLLVRGCKVIVAADAPERSAVLRDALQFPAVKFAVVGGATFAPNVSILPASSGLRSAVAAAVERSAG
jgi:hypothetical protein